MDHLGKHRRTRELSGALGLELFELIFNGPYALRVAVLSLRTIATLARTRPSLLFVQNPSLFLASLVCLLRPLFGYRLVVDRHSSFKLDTMGSRSPKYRLFHLLSRYTVRTADLTIITNEPLKSLVEEWGGVGFVLPDKFPELPLARRIDLGPGRHVLFICTFSDDEPVADVLEAARLLGDGTTVHVTGNVQGKRPDLPGQAPPNVHFTGFLPEDEYQSTLASCDVVLALTTKPHIMQCGAYEAVSAHRPLVIGPDEAMVQYFSKGRIATEIDSVSIAAALKEALETEPGSSRKVGSCFWSDPETGKACSRFSSQCSSVDRPSGSCLVMQERLPFHLRNLGFSGEPFSVCGLLRKDRNRSQLSFLHDNRSIQSNDRNQIRPGCLL